MMTCNYRNFVDFQHHLLGKVKKFASIIFTVHIIRTFNGLVMQTCGKLWKLIFLTRYKHFFGIISWSLLETNHKLPDAYDWRSLVVGLDLPSQGEIVCLISIELHLSPELFPELSQLKIKIKNKQPVVGIIHEVLQFWHMVSI